MNSLIPILCDSSFDEEIEELLSKPVRFPPALMELLLDDSEGGNLIRT